MRALGRGRCGVSYRPQSLGFHKIPYRTLHANRRLGPALSSPTPSTPSTLSTLSSSIEVPYRVPCILYRNGNAAVTATTSHLRHFSASNSNNNSEGGARVRVKHPIHPSASNNNNNSKGRVYRVFDPYPHPSTSNNNNNNNSKGGVKVQVKHPIHPSATNNNNNNNNSKGRVYRVFDPYPNNNNNNNDGKGRVYRVFDPYPHPSTSNNNNSKGGVRVQVKHPIKPSASNNNNNNNNNDDDDDNNSKGGVRVRVKHPIHAYEWVSWTVSNDAYGLLESHILDSSRRASLRFPVAVTSETLDSDTRDVVPDALNPPNPEHQSPLSPPDPNIPHPRKTYDALVIDCEMVVMEGHELGLLQIAVVDFFTGDIVLRNVVRPGPPGLVTDWRKDVTGFNKKKLSTAAKRGVVLSGWQVARRKIFEVTTSKTIFIGHSLANDLRVLRIASDRVVDSMWIMTRAVFGDQEKVPRNWSLKTSCEELLGVAVQQKRGPHSPLEDAFATRELVLECVLNPEKLTKWAAAKRVTLANLMKREQAIKEAKEKKKLKRIKAKQEKQAKAEMEKT